MTLSKILKNKYFFFIILNNFLLLLINIAQNVGSMMMWDISTKINTQRMIAQIEDGSFFPNTLDYEKENQFRYLLKIQKKKLLKWLAAVTWDNLESDIKLVIVTLPFLVLIITPCDNCDLRRSNN